GPAAWPAGATSSRTRSTPRPRHSLAEPGTCGARRPACHASGPPRVFMRNIGTEDSGRRPPAVHQDRSAAKAGGERTSVPETTTASFVELRELLFSVVYNLLGTVSDTEDVLQDTWLAWASRGREEVANARAYLLRIAVNQALSRLRRARRNRGAYVGARPPPAPGPRAARAAG